LGGRFNLKLLRKIIVWKPIVKKYSNGKVKRTLKKGLKVLEMVKRERNKIINIDILFIQLSNSLFIFFFFYLYIFYINKK
jgi:hypothetical protein